MRARSEVMSVLAPLAAAPSVVLALAASASSMSERPKVERSASDAAPLPVKYGNLSVALVSPARAESSTSNACTSVPMTSPSAVCAPDALVAPVPPTLMPMVLEAETAPVELVVSIPDGEPETVRLVVDAVPK